MLEGVHGARAQRRVEQGGDMPHEQHAREQQEARQRAPEGPAEGTKRRRALSLAEAVAERLAGAERERAPQANPRAAEDDQRRGDGEQQHVLDHVRPEQLRAERVERRIQGQHDRGQAGVEGDASPAPLPPRALRGDRAAVADPVEDPNEDDRDQRRIE